MTATSCRTRPIFLLVVGALLALMLVVPGGANAQRGPGAPSVVASGTQLWAATLTVGIERGVLGYSTVAGRDAGALSSRSFTWLGTTYTVRNVLSNRSPRDDRTWDVLIDFMPPLPDGYECLTLRLGDQWLNLADGKAIAASSSGAASIWAGRPAPASA